MLSLVPGAVRAQAIIGTAEKPAVEVDQSVLDRLGASPTLPDMYLNRHPAAPVMGAPSSGEIILKRPSQRPTEIRPVKPQAPTIVKPAKPQKGDNLQSAPVETTPVKPPKPTPPPAAKPAPEPQPEPTPTPKPEKTDGIPPRPPIEAPTIVDPDPVASEKPVEPIKPVEPVKPAEPVKPIEPTTPIEPVKPAEPVKPVEPITPVEPTKPVEPVTPVEPVKPAPPEAQPSPRRGGALTPGTAAPAMNHSWGGVGMPMRGSDDAPLGMAPVEPERAPEPQSQSPSEPTSLVPPAVKPVSPPKEPPPLPTQLTPAVEGKASISFIKDSAEISSESEAILGNVARKLAQQPDLTVLLQAFASASGESASRARHMSLSRALAVRSKLIESGVRSTRIEVRALGDKIDAGDPERVDLILQKRDKN